MTAKMTQEKVVKLFLKNSLKPLETYSNSQTPLKSECLKCKNIIYPRLDKVTLRGHQCGYCAGRKGAGEKAVEVVIKIGHTPIEPYKSALKPWKMICGGCGKIISPQYNTLQQGGWGCSYCGNARAGARRKEAGAKEAGRLMREAFCKPIEPYPGAHVPWKARCMKCDSLIQPRFAGIQSGQGGCQKCGIKARAKSRMHTPEQAMIIAKKNKLKPLEPYKGARAKWKCECLRCGKISNPFFAAIRDGKYGCLWCAKKIVDPGEARKKMLLAKLEPLVAYPGSDIGWLCRCMKCKREVTPAYGSIRDGQGGCKWCKGISASVDPVIAVQALLLLQIQPLEPFKTSHSKWKSRCLRCENEISPSYHDIKQGSGGCKYCAPNFVNLPRINEVMKKVGLEPQEKYPGSRASWKVKHIGCGRIFKVEYANIRKASSCRYCAGVAVIPKEAVTVMKNLGLITLVTYPGAKKPWKCKCLVCKKIIYPTYGSSSSRSSGCIYCAGRKVDSKDAVTYMKSRELIPLVPFPGARKPWKCKCKICKNIVSPQYSSVKGGQGGCKYCADWGIDYLGKGFIYLMTNPGLNAHKVGISGETKTSQGDRVSKHQKSGWELYKRLDFATADEAHLIEQAVLNWVRKDKKLNPFLSEFEMPQGGYTETVDASEIDLPTIWA